MRKLDLALSLEPWTSAENLMSQVEVWPHLPGKHLQACKGDTMIPTVSPSNLSQGTCHPNRGYTLKFQEITPTVGMPSTGWNLCPCMWKANAYCGTENGIHRWKTRLKGNGGLLFVDEVAQRAYQEGCFELMDTLKKVSLFESTLVPARCMCLTFVSKIVFSVFF